MREKEKAFTLLLLVWSVAREGGQSSCNGAGGAECWVGKQFRRCAERIHYSQAKTHLHVQTSSHIIRTIFSHVLSLVFHLVCSGGKRAICEGKSQQPFFSETPQTCTSFHFLLCTSSVFHLHLTTPPPITHHETSSVFSPPPKWLGSVSPATMRGNKEVANASYFLILLCSLTFLGECFWWRLLYCKIRLSKCSVGWYKFCPVSFHVLCKYLHVLLPYLLKINLLVL